MVEWAYMCVWAQVRAALCSKTIHLHHPQALFVPRRDQIHEILRKRLEVHKAACQTSAAVIGVGAQSNVLGSMTEVEYQSLAHNSHVNCTKAILARA